MKNILKNINNEPNDLREYRNNTPNPSYIGGNFSSQKLKQALLDEQGYICAYCMKKISLELNEKHKPKVEVEHYKPRENNKELELNYNNLLAVCNGSVLSYPEKELYHHCDKTKGEKGKVNGNVELKVINPLRKDKSEDLIVYTLNGNIKSIYVNLKIAPILPMF